MDWLTWFKELHHQDTRDDDELIKERGRHAVTKRELERTINNLRVELAHTIDDRDAAILDRKTAEAARDRAHDRADQLQESINAILTGKVWTRLSPSEGRVDIICKLVDETEAS